VQLRLLGSSVANRNLDEDVFLRSLRVFDKNVEVTITIKDAGLCEFKFRILAAAAPVLFD
jgi:hypothetical protein